jgi:threonine dehydrogenase-like Zn-dependent dehydrogenase
MEKGDVLGHEFMGIVEDVGSEVKNIRKGDRVVTAFDIGCHKCDYCTGKQKLYSSCDNTNDSKQQEQLYGHRTAGKTTTQKVY